MEQPLRIGDRLRHPTRPDWGVGVVLGVSPLIDRGQRGQRVTLRFDGAGVKTISTLVVQLKAADGNDEDLSAASLSELPADLTGTGSPLMRLERALAWYRFDGTGRSLLDWAIARSSVRDPLAHLTRQELELAFEGFFRRLDFLVRELVDDLHRAGARETVHRLLAHAPARARALLQRNEHR